MNEYLTEKAVLNKLGIEDFRHLTKAKVIELTSMMDKMDPAVAKKALEQFPNFSSTVKEIIVDYKNLLNKALETNSESMKYNYNIINPIIESLLKLLERDNLEFEERKYIIDQLKSFTVLYGEKDSENKKFIGALCKLGAMVFAVAMFTLGTAIGNNSKFELKR